MFNDWISYSWDRINPMEDHSPDYCENCQKQVALEIVDSKVFIYEYYMPFPANNRVTADEINFNIDYRACFSCQHCRKKLGLFFKYKEITLQEIIGEHEPFTYQQYFEANLEKAKITATSIIPKKDTNIYRITWESSYKIKNQIFPFVWHSDIRHSEIQRFNKEEYYWWFQAQYEPPEFAK